MMITKVRESDNNEINNEIGVRIHRGRPNDHGRSRAYGRSFH